MYKSSTNVLLNLSSNIVKYWFTDTYFDEIRAKI